MESDTSGRELEAPDVDVYFYLDICSNKHIDA